jgi:hypothetical protein
MLSRPRRTDLRTDRSGTNPLLFVGLGLAARRDRERWKPVAVSFLVTSPRCIKRRGVLSWSAMGSFDKKGTRDMIETLDHLDTTIREAGVRIAMALSDVITALQASSATAATAMTDAATAITDLTAEIKNNGGAPTQAQLDALTALATTLQTQGSTLDAAAKAADPGPQPNPGP